MIRTKLVIEWALSDEEPMSEQLGLFRSQLISLFLFMCVFINVDMARRGPRRRPTRKVVFTKTQYDQEVNKLVTEKRYEDYATAWMSYIVCLEDNVTSQIYQPRIKGGERLCNDIHLLNQELELVLIPLKQQKTHIVYIAQRIFLRKGPKFLFETLPDNNVLKTVFMWTDYQLSRFYRLWVETRIIWEEFKEAYLFMQAKCYHLHKL